MASSVTPAVISIISAQFQHSDTTLVVAYGGVNSRLPITLPSVPSDYAPVPDTPSGPSTAPLSLTHLNYVAVPQEAITPEDLLIFDLNSEELDMLWLFCEWNHSDLLIINGRGIPIKHWGWFYKKHLGAKEFVWKKVRVKRGN
ncbi:hypothetical protein OH76DRAFT_1490544 [Lentinus brumalis]|uniref:Uncharacterized protein n=1 Tax=Lentinus brumalis TaxID=2498619 RepID=A0A371CIN7_9APHY|nr:hypothetical protein OH76DRAFT_1490544 [Polyporus brumalis]